MSRPFGMGVRMTAREALAQAQAILAAAHVDTPRLDAQLLLMWTMKARREDLARDPERMLSARETLIFTKAMQLRAQRRPLPYITGEQWFYGRPFKINRAVLIPRPETELLVQAALNAVADVPFPRLADIGVGSGCIAVTLACERPDAGISATDLSPDALKTARKNVVRHGVGEQVSLFQGDLLAPLSFQPPYHAVVSNPPYVTEEEVIRLQPEVRDYEPPLALSGAPGATGPDGDTLHRRLLEDARAYLVPSGWALLEVGQGQAARVADFARALGYNRVDVVDDLAGIGRVVRARWQ